MKENKSATDWNYLPNKGGLSIPQVLVWVPTLITLNVTAENSSTKEDQHEKA
ncbi:TPA: hypothetical protein RMM65_003118 [Enterobacter ludwigii]|uniref:hypothetical protein n=1 Tax=Escherichia coli TaxID=562 RepID=UPI00148511E1|nr:hypothetical protein [Escherichia coli]EME7516441.1 hypothetical protein [Salmonella enterica]BCT99056.1 hypothetical protein [uncultured bacterium]HCR2089747.1 hypothetical protein [Enterobacter hormaechei subsp. steigerwaltii]HDT3175977.1 hypothetical protein [Klebsiella pneumoniae subsp. pneumoniae]HDW3266151.1 hypothetical protein [Enterobacter ludwigii]HDX3912540.1 hypothetical protein [Enterobacter kobei]